MSTEFFNDQWRIPSNENQNKVSNYSMDFDGSVDYVRINSNTFLQPSEAELNSNGYSVSAWIKIDSSLTSEVGIFANDGVVQTGTIYGLEFSINTTRTLRIRKGDGTGRFSADIRSAVTAETVPINAWTHVTFVLPSANENTWQIYINGVAGTMNVGGSGGAVGYSGVYPGGIGRIRFQYFVGQIDQVTVFDYALSASQVSTLYGGGTAITNPMSLSPKPIAYYQLGDQSVDNGANYLVPNNSLRDYVFDFDGNNDYIDTPQIDLGSTNTISFWINTTTTTQGAIFGDPNAYSDYALFSQPALNSIAFRLGNNDSGYYQLTVSSGLLNDGNWHHHCLSRDGVTINYYIDGILQTNVTNDTLNSSAGTNTTIENIFANQIAAFKYGGKLSNVAFFSTALTGPQVETLYNNGSPNDISSLNPVAWYKLNAADTFDGADWTITDYGSGSNDGTSSGMDSSNLVVSDLQQTSGYSPYALDLDGVDDYLDCGDSNTFSFGNGTADSPFSISAWINMDDATTFRIVSKAGSNGNEYFLTNGGDDKLNFILYDTGGVGNIRAKYDTALTSYQGQWIHVVGTYSGVNRQNGIELYLNGSLLTTLKVLNSPYTAMSNTTQPLEIGRSTSSSYANGKFSNVSVFNTELTSTQVTEIYNSGIPSDLNTFSGTAPVSWWQLGSNSSFNTNWTCLDEIGTNNAVSANMTNNDIVDGVGYSASGLGTSSIDIVGDAPYSTANGLSENMDVLDRTTDVPS